MRPIKGYKKDFLLAILEEMLLTRRFEEKAGQMYGLKKIGGFCHLYNGQEAVSAGIAAATKRGEDALLTGYRDHGHAISWGITPNEVMAELYGKETGCSKGKGGSMHMFDAEANMYGGNGIVGGQIPVAAGVAFAQRYRKEKNISVVLFGDGAIHQGAFHESMNLAKVWKLPILFVCENNQYGMGTAMERVSAVKDLYVKGAAYDIPSKQINGMDVIEVLEEVKAAREQILGDETPVFFEIKTYRYKGHSMSDPAKYRTKEEMEKFQKQDPIQSLKDRMIEAKMLTDEDYKAMDKRLKGIVMEAVKFAEESPEPPLSAMYDDILV
jgi:pyruvate dehydrogenase E1 component alpha subunit